MTDFRDVAKELAPRGGWLRDNTSQAYLGALGGTVSDSLALWREGVKARFASTCPADALVHLGDTRQIERAPRETEEAYRVRLRRAFEIHALRGTPGAWAELLAPLGVDADTVYPWNWYEILLGTWWSTLWPAVDSRSGPWGGPHEADDGTTCDEGALCDISGIVDSEVHWIRRQVRRWKWAGAYPVAIWIALGGVYTDIGLTADSGILCDDGPFERAILRLGNVWDQETELFGEPPLKADQPGLYADQGFLE